MKAGEAFLRKKQKAVFDEHLVCREIYNPNAYSIIFSRNKVQDRLIIASKIPLGAETIICKPYDWVFLPHGYYLAKASNGADLINCITNFGDAIGKGNKLPSLPIAEGSLKNQ